MEDQQERDLRYKLEHFGDVVVEMIEGFGCNITKGFRGIWLTRHINGAKRDRNNVVYRIGERVVTLRKDTADLFADDTEMTTLFSEFDGADQKLEDMINEREERLDRIRGKIKAATAVMEEDSFPDDMAAAPA
nr:hypothetical protein [Desulfobulbaceae bacterium]